MADFFVRLKERVGAGITTVTTKSRVAVETTRLRRQIRKIAQEKKEALAQLGARAYQEIGQRGQLDPEGMRDAVERIQELDRSIEDLGKEITRLAALDAATPWPAGGEEKPLATCTCGAPLSEGDQVLRQLRGQRPGDRCQSRGGSLSAVWGWDLVPGQVLSELRGSCNREAGSDPPDRAEAVRPSKRRARTLQLLP
jgi:hypothetical protein